MTNENLFENAGRLFFTRNQIKDLEKQLNAAGVNMPTDSFAGYVALNVTVFSVFFTILLAVYKPANSIVNGIATTYLNILPAPILWIAIFIFSMILVYLSTMAIITSYLLMKVEDRRRKLESNLPDFLILVGSNIKAGMTLDQAMWYSAKPEFGLLSTEVKSIVKGAFSGESMGGSLDKLGERFDSRIFQRTIALLKQATATGGELTSVLDKTAEDVRNNSIVRKEISASLILYEIFVLVASVVGTPFLFAVAGKIIQVFEKIAPQVSSAGGGFTGAGGGLIGAFSSVKIGTPLITSSDFFWFSVPTILITALISSFIVSVIRTGNRNQGMKYFPFILVTAYLVYWIVSAFVDTFFAALA